MFVFEWFLTMSRTIALILFTVALAALGAEIAVNVRDADIVRNGYAEIDLRLKDTAPEGGGDLVRVVRFFVSRRQ